ncbi:MAG: conserved hypothetical protein [Arenicellales bacterium IbO2]|nr:DUF3726 domain-containing protein [Gammaproteobacteria bacterium]MDA8023498.1 DUF3726 domain-containing protein [Gammaproteobacteria bacterium]CAJ2376543.1 MAG: conserved hypothetical protein [Arenicellales bacterium IbO2]
MICSLNQIEQSARKAARGAGFAWGLADETGRAVRWLHANGFRGAAALADWLDGDIKSSGAPRSLSGVWRAPRGALDPLRTGAALGDCIESAGAVETGAIAHPLLAAGFLGDAAHIDELVIELQWPGARLQCMRGGARRGGTRAAFEAARAAHLKCSVARAPGTSAGLRRRAARFGECRVPRAVWLRLDRHARRTYVEASEASRLAGAGAGLHDND